MLHSLTYGIGNFEIGRTLHCRDLQVQAKSKNNIAYPLRLGWGPNPPPRLPIFWHPDTWVVITWPVWLKQDIHLRYTFSLVLVVQFVEGPWIWAHIHTFIASPLYSKSLCSLWIALPSLCRILDILNLCGTSVFAKRRWGQNSRD